MLMDSMARSILVSGFDNIAAIQPLMAQGRVFATVDQLSTKAGVGVWNTLPKVVQMVSSVHQTSRLDMATSTIRLTPKLIFTGQ